MSSPLNDSGLDERSGQPAVALKDGSTELYDQVRHRTVIDGGLYFFNKAIIGFPDLGRRSHLALCMFYERVGDSILNALVEFPKSHLKTSTGTVGKVLHHFARMVVRGQDPIDRLAIASNTKTNSMRMLRLVKEVPKSNLLFQNFFPELIPEFSNEEVWNQQEIIFPRSRAFTDPSVDTLGVGGAATSRHYTGIIEDDMLDEGDANSPTAIRTAIELHQYYTSLLVDDSKDWYLVNEHAWTQYDLNNHIVENEPDTAVFSVGASTGLNPVRSRHVPEEILKLTEVWGDGQGVWPERFNTAALLRRRQKAGARIFNAVFENNPFDPDVVDFKEEWLRYWEPNANGDIRVCAADGIEMEIIPKANLHRVGAYDPALSEKSDADRSAFVAVGVDSKERIFVLDVVAKRIDPLKFIQEVFAKSLAHDLQRVAVESVLFQKTLKKLLDNVCKDWNRDQFMAKQLGRTTSPRYVYPGLFEEVKPPRGKAKHERIRALVATAFEQGRVYIRREHTDFIDEYLHFPKGKTVDVLDAFAYTADLWLPGVDEDDLLAQQHAEQAWLNQRDGTTGY